MAALRGRGFLTPSCTPTDHSPLNRWTRTQRQSHDQPKVRHLRANSRAPGCLPSAPPRAARPASGRSRWPFGFPAVTSLLQARGRGSRTHSGMHVGMSENTWSMQMQLHVLGRFGQKWALKACAGPAATAPPPSSAVASRRSTSPSEINTQHR